MSLRDVLMLHLPLAVALLASPAPLAAAEPSPPEKPAAPRVELKDGDRVVFLGNTLIEREQKYGYWETMLTARYPDRNITFRNLGWDGDTVWADSRGLFDPPAAGYARMLEQVKGLKPTVIFLGYGMNEALDRKPMGEFTAQYEKLLGDLAKVSAEGVRFVILTPTRFEQKPPPLPDVGALNNRLASCRDALNGLAAKRSLLLIDLFSEPGKDWRRPRPVEAMTDDGMHLNATGYFHTAARIVHLTADSEPFLTQTVITADGRDRDSKGAKVSDIGVSGGAVRFTLSDEQLPLFGRLLSLPGEEGKYRLTVDGEAVASIAFPQRGIILIPTEGQPVLGKNVPLASRMLGLWYDELRSFGGTPHPLGPETKQIEALRSAIVAKNELYFHSWRPQNVTYLFLFRKHEQGQNAKETAEFEKLVAGKEAEIAKLKKPVPHKYELVREK